MARRATSHPQKEALMSHLPQPNCKHEDHWIGIPKMGPGWRIRRRIQHSSDHHIGDAPTPSTWNLREDLTDGLPSAQWMHAYCFNLLASHPDSSNMRMSPSQTGPFTFAHGGAVTVIQEFNANQCTPPQCQIHLPYWLSCK